MAKSADKNAFEPQKSAAKHVAKVAATTVAQIAAFPGYNLPMGSYTTFPGFCIGRLPDRFFGIFGQILRTFFSDILNICSRAFHELLQSQLLLFQERSLSILDSFAPATIETQRTVTIQIHQRICLSGM